MNSVRDGSKTSDEVCGVVISYRPPPQFLRNVLRLAEQVGHLVIVDNTPAPDVPDAIEGLRSLDGCTVLCNGKNLGIAAALNIGIRQAISLGFSWIVCFDQDSAIGEGYMEAMLAAGREAERQGRVGLICPRYIDEGLGVFLPPPRAANGEITGCLTSGTLMRASTFGAMGPMEEKLFIDYVDHEYCLRLRSAGYKIVECQGAILQHSLGRMSYETLLGIKISTTNHSPQRRYYIHRNRLTLVIRYWLKDKEWALREFKGLVKDSVKILLLEEKKLAKAKYMARAFYDALFGRLGARVDL